MQCDIGNSPNDMAPRMGTDTLNPDLPSCAYDTFVLSKLVCRDSGSLGPASPIVEEVDVFCFDLEGLGEPIGQNCQRCSRKQV